MEKATLRNGKGMPGHNDRTLQNSNENVIEGKGMAKVWVRNHEEGKMMSIPLGQGMLKKQELMYYENEYGAALNRKNAHYKSKGNKKAIKTIEQYYESHPPKETILQIGKGDSHTPDELFIAARAYIQKMTQKYGSNFKILSISIHTDEGAPHAHIRWVLDCETEYGDKVIDQNKALDNMCIEPTKSFNEAKYREEHPEASKDAVNRARKQFERYDNRLTTFTDRMRETWYDVLKEKGYEIDTVTSPTNRSRRNKLTQAWKLEKAQESLKAINTKIKIADNNLAYLENDLMSTSEEIYNKYKLEYALAYIEDKGLLEDFEADFNANYE